MEITRIAVDRPVAICMFYAAVVLLGIISLRELVVDLLPDISYPRLSVVTRCSGVAPAEIETLVTAPLETVVSRVPGLRRVESVSKEGLSFMALDFDWGTNMDFTTLRIREQLDSARDRLPEDAESPTIISFDPQSKPIMTLAVTGRKSLLELKEFAEEMIKPRLEQVEGIGSAETTGGVEREIRVDVDPDKLSLYGLTIDDVALRLDASNRSLLGGTIRKGTSRFAVRVLGEFTSLDEVAETGLKVTPEGAIIRLGDIASVIDSLKERQGVTRLDGTEGVGILVRKEWGGNTVEVTKRARRILNQIRGDNPDVEIRVVSEQSRAIENAIGAVINEILQGAVLAFLVLLLFLQEWKTPLIIDTVIPISILGTFSLLYAGGVTLNIMSLGGLALGVGMLDDCAVIVSENIFRQRSLGKDLKEAASTGAKEVGPAIVSTALTTAVVFLPVIYVHGVAGRLFKDTALTVTFSLLASLLVSLTLIATLQSRPFFSGSRTGGRRRREQQSEKIRRPFRSPLRTVFRGFNTAYGSFVSVYERCLAWSLDNKGAVFAGALVFFAIGFVPGILIRREWMPNTAAGAFELNLKTPAEYSFEQTSGTALLIEKEILAQEPVRTVFSQVGIVSGTEGADPDISLNTVRILVEVDKPERLQAVLDTLDRRLVSHPDCRWSVVREQSPLACFPSFSASAISLKVKGDDLDLLGDVGMDLGRRLRRIPGIVGLETGFGEGKPEFKITLNNEAMKKYGGLAPSSVGDFLVNAVRGRAATRYREMEKKVDIWVRMEGTARQGIEALLDRPLSYAGNLIPLRDLVNCEIIRGPREIRRENQQREVLVTASLGDRKISEVVPGIEKVVAGLRLPAGCRIVFGGEREEMAKSFRSLILAFILAALLTYMILAAQFESFLHPLLVMSTLPMGAAGSAAALFLTGQTLNVISVIGAVVLAGIVVDSAVVKIDCMNRLRKGGMGLRQAVTEAGRLRLRPILMSTLSTLFGLVPMALGLENGSELMRPLAVAVIGGLASSTLLTLILIPALYEWVEGKRPKRNLG